MEIVDLKKDERLALVGCLRAVVHLDGSISEEEIRSFHDLQELFGEELFTSLSDEAESRFQDVEDLMHFLANIRRAPARELIFSTLLEAALGQGIDARESELIDWLQQEWNIPVFYEAEAERAG